MTEQEVNYLRRAFSDLKVEGPIADLGCGHGRHAAQFAGSLFGRPVVGLELDRLSLTERLPGFEAVRGDFFRPPFRPGSLGGAYAWYSTLFVFEDEQIEQLLRLTASLLKPGGRLIFQTMPYSRAAAQPGAGFDSHLPDGSLLHEEAAFDSSTGRDLALRRLTKPDGETLSAQFFIRYYPLPHLSRLLERAGFTLRWMHGDLHGSPVTPASSDLIVGVERNHA
jgi:SAM-dependent methyltransferase